MMKHKVVLHNNSMFKFFDSKNLVVLIYIAVFFFNTSCSKDALEITIPTSSLVVTSLFSSQTYSGNNFSASPTSFQLMFAGSLQTSKTYDVYLGAYSNSTCSSTAPGVFSLSANPVPLTSGLANFSSVNYTNSGPLEEAIYLKASTQPSSINTCVGPISIRHKFSSGAGYTLFQPGGLGAAGASNASKLDYSNSIQVDADGRYVVVGNSTNPAGGSELVVWRYNPDGSLDSTFGNGATTGLGYALFQPGGLGAAGASNANKVAWAADFKIDSQGRFVIFGNSTNSAGGYELVIWRYNSDGSLDSTFGNGATAGLGYVIFQHNGLSAAGGANASKYEFATGIEFDSQGRYVLAGSSFNSSGGGETAIWRYNPDGSLDTTFGNGSTTGLGFVLFQHNGLGVAGKSNSSKYDGPNSFKIDWQGRYVLAGASWNAVGGDEFVIWRYNPDGSLDSTFGNAATVGLGYVLFQHNGLGAAGAINTSKFEYPTDLQIDSQGRYVVSGTSKNSTGGLELVIWRYNSDGSLDSTFGNGTTAGLGYVLFQPGGFGTAGATSATKYDAGNKLQIDTEGRYIISGPSKNSVGGYEIAIWRYNPDGTIDSTYGIGVTAGLGYTLFQHGGLSAAGAGNTAKYDFASSLKIDSKGRYILPGSSNNPAGGYELVLWRYLPSGTIDQ